MRMQMAEDEYFTHELMVFRKQRWKDKKIAGIHGDNG
jgi:hypothetical protein